MLCLLMDFIISPSYGHLFFSILGKQVQSIYALSAVNGSSAFSISDDGCPLGVVVRE